MTEGLPAMVHAFFRDCWDPACVGGDPHARDEYRAYEETFLALLRTGAFSRPGRLRAFVEGTEESIRGEVAADRADRIVEALAALVGDGTLSPTFRATGQDSA